MKNLDIAIQDRTRSFHGKCTLLCHYYASLFRSFRGPNPLSTGVSPSKSYPRPWAHRGLPITPSMHGEVPQSGGSQLLLKAPEGLTLAIRIQNIHQYSNDSYQSSLAFASTKGWPVYLVSRIVVLYHHYPYQKCHSGGIPWCTQFSDTSVVVFDRTWAHLLPRTSVLSTC